ncbi:two-component response regulator [Gracilibacillus boraciitolerans JCM 21714]|uniref:Two-component response regulator n=1 Tax=Gracilibacillus boraciitolerans JCM 21714 TaxID=1298598 RepID=W4VQT4_9BACI|nr:response regulator [Gracilibacillus boraciitolerans]GAE95249.1 two-component response regulator [Gracilibacillus boraciitolerans JCM 21714]
MIKLLIVDDEVHIREGISKVINWKELDIDVLPAAASAEEAFETIRKQKPDILLTDIRMTGRNGLELADLAKQHDQEIEILILSGYDDFHYAQQAMKKGGTRLPVENK